MHFASHSFSEDPQQVSADLQFAIIISTLMLLLFIGLVVLLLVINNNRRNRHRAEIAELRATRDRAVMEAEREATGQALGEVGRELHDNVGQLLTLAQMGVADVVEGGGDVRLTAAMAALDEGIEEVRRLGRSLNTDRWRDRSFADAVSAEASRIERIARVQVPLVLLGRVPELEPDAKTILFRVFQEITTNALKHAHAHSIAITLDGGPPFAMRIRDDGRGFSDAGTSAGAGLANIRRRCSLIGFTADLHTSPGDGCTWTIQRSTDHAA